MQYLAFTCKEDKIVRELRNDVYIESIYTQTGERRNYGPWRGLWDTGASSSCIHHRIKEQMGLQAIGTVPISTANGVVEVDTCVISVSLPNGVMVENLLVSCADIGEHTDILLGMDIISFGNFAISNNNGKTNYSFVIPSIGDVDYVLRSRNLNGLKDHRGKGRNGK